MEKPSTPPETTGRHRAPDDNTSTHEWYSDADTPVSAALRELRVTRDSAIVTSSALYEPSSGAQALMDQRAHEARLAKLASSEVLPHRRKSLGALAVAETIHFAEIVKQRTGVVMRGMGRTALRLTAAASDKLDHVAGRITEEITAPRIYFGHHRHQEEAYPGVGVIEDMLSTV